MRKRYGFNYPLFIKRNIIAACFILAAVFFFNFIKKPALASNFLIKETLPFSLESVEIEGLTQTEEKIYPESERNNTYSEENQGISLENEISAEELTRLENIEYLKSKFYIVDARTDILPGDILPADFISRDFTIDNSKDGPKILIIHTHSTEGYADSDMTKDMAEGIWGVGERLKEILEGTYGIETLHDVGRYDIVDGKGKILGAYERMEPCVKQILKDNPSIEMVIDMHRDGIDEDRKLLTTISGKSCAQVMFVNGLSRIYDEGELKAISGLENSFVTDNLAFSFKLQSNANIMYPGLMRKIYVNAYRYSLHMLPKSLIVEVGAQTNTKEEALNAMEPFAKILAAEILK